MVDPSQEFHRNVFRCIIVGAFEFLSPGFPSRRSDQFRSRSYSHSHHHRHGTAAAEPPTCISKHPLSRPLRCVAALSPLSRGSIPLTTASRFRQAPNSKPTIPQQDNNSNDRSRRRCSAPPFPQRSPNRPPLCLRQQRQQRGRARRSWI